VDGSALMRRLATACLVLATGGCAGRQSVLDPASDQASALHGLLGLMLLVCGVAYLLVLLFLGWAIWRARRRLPQEIDLAPDDRGLRLGLGGWAALMAAGLVVLAGGSFLVDRALATRDLTGPADIRVTAQQWWWRLEYRDPAGGRWIETANELHLPLGRPTRIEIRSADVIHSFWIPNLSGKIDMVPGRVNHLTITPRRLGWVRGQCAEFCGLQHAKMALDVKVDAPDAFAAWLAAQARPASAPADPAAARGLALVTSGSCGACHAIRGSAASARPGPDLTHVASRQSLAAGTLPMSRGALMGWIVQPQALKPGAEMPATGLSPADALAVVSYLESLR
jgi:cytochrome c oxidase subunit 2